MKIVILDAFTLNPGDLSWEALKSLGKCDIHDRTSPEQVVQRAMGSEILLTNKTPVNRESISRLKDLKYIGVMATGYNIVDVEVALERNIVVTNVPTYGTRSVGQMTMAMILELAQHVGLHSQAVHQGEWSRSKDWSFWKKPIIELEELTLGIIGFGRIGQTTAGLAKAFGMEVIAFDPIKPTTMPDGVLMHVKETVLKNSDFLCLHCPLTPETEKLINKDSLHIMKKDSFVINTSRGPLVNEKDLADALNSGVIAGAALDVLSIEPPPSDNPLLSAKNCIITPHIAWATKSARERLMKVVVQNIMSYLDGTYINVVKIM